mmetsp:Transcript_15358/g.19017  ORF Transcript_15358/g.19017 Transcript_15358/m.19017 type:complete len:293 (+) Transcript_15358:277-1155(+)
MDVMKAMPRVLPALALGCILLQPHKFLEVFKYDSSPVDWCEDNYVHSEHIAEFYNTVSNLPFIGCALAGYYYYKDNPQLNKVEPYFWVIWALYLFIGLGSFYFHGTLSVAGQVLDEFPIVLFGAYGSLLLIPKSKWKSLAHRKHVFTSKSTLISLISLLLLCMRFPVVSHVVCMCGFPAFSYAAIRNYLEFRKSGSKKQSVGRNLIIGAFVSFFFAFSSWIIDRFFCNQSALFVHDLTGYKIHFHALWHLFMSITMSFIITFGLIILLLRSERDRDPFKIKFAGVYPYAEIL